MKSGDDGESVSSIDWWDAAVHGADRSGTRWERLATEREGCFLAEVLGHPVKVFSAPPRGRGASAGWRAESDFTPEEKRTRCSDFDRYGTTAPTREGAMALFDRALARTSAPTREAFEAALAAEWILQERATAVREVLDAAGRLLGRSFDGEEVLDTTPNRMRRRVEAFAAMAAVLGFEIHGDRVVETWRGRAEGRWLPVEAIEGPSTNGTPTPHLVRLERGVLLEVCEEADDVWSVEVAGELMASVEGLEAAKRRAVLLAVR